MRYQTLAISSIQSSRIETLRQTLERPRLALAHRRRGFGIAPRLDRLVFADVPSREFVNIIMYVKMHASSRVLRDIVFESNRRRVVRDFVAFRVAGVFRK